MALNINQFGQTTVAGQLDLEAAGTVLSCRVSVNQGTALVAGQGVKLDTTQTGGVPSVLATTAATDALFGFVVRNLKDATYPAQSRVEIALESSVMFLTADATSPTILRGAPIEYNPTANTVLQWAGVNPIQGFALDSAANAGDLPRIYLAPSAFTASAASGVKNVIVTATLAQINAGLTLITGSTGKKITVTHFAETVAGNFATGTSVSLQSGTTAVVVETTAEAGLTNGAILVPGSANVTLGAGYATNLPAGEALVVRNNGSAQTGGTSITYNISYTQY